MNVQLPCVPGDEGVGEVVEIGKLVCRVEPGQRVVLTSRLRGTWRYYGVYHERDLHVVSPNLALAEASMLTIAPCTAYRMLKDFRDLKHGQTVIQNAANSAVGQSVIQLCNAWGMNTFNIVASHCGFQTIKEHLLKIGASAVYTVEEANMMSKFHSSLLRPVLALNCMGGKHEDVLLKLLDVDGHIVSYGDAYYSPPVKSFLRPDVTFSKFCLNEWKSRSGSVVEDVMFKELIQLMVICKFVGPKYVPIELRNYIYALKNTCHNESFNSTKYIFDFTI